MPFRTSGWSRGCASVLTLTLTVAGLAIVPAAPARAAEDPVALEAKRHYEEGTKAYNLGEYPRAIAEFKATYNAKPDPLLLYNIAQSYRLAGDAGQALFFYKSFLRNMPEATNRREAEDHIRKLEKQLAEQKKDTATIPPTVGVAPSSGATPPPATAAPVPSAPSAATTPVAAPPVSSPPPPGATAPPAAVATVPSTGSGTTAPSPPPPVNVFAAPPPAAASNTQPPPHPHLVATAPPPTGDQSEDRPFYKKWWFWVGAAGVVVLLGGIAAANARKRPSTTLGPYDPDFM